MQINFISIKEINKKNILKLIINNGPISRISISKLLGISRPTVSSYINELIENRLIVEIGKSDSTKLGGKKAVLIEFNSKAGYIIGVMLGVNYIRIGLSDLKSNIIKILKIPTEESLGPEMVINKLIKGLEEIIIKTKISKHKILGIGIAATGLVDSDNGIVIFSPNLSGWSNIELKKIIEKKFKLPVFVENECRVKTIAEKIFGLAKNINNFVCILTGIGIGSGIFINNKLLVGKKGMSGEIGHIVTDINSNIICHCGNKGCLEVSCSTRSLFNFIIHDLKKGINSALKPNVEFKFDSLVELYNEGDEAVVKNVNTNARILGIGISNIIKIFNPDTVIIQGPVTKFGEKYLDVVKESVKVHTFPMVKDEYNIQFSQLDENIGIIGATATIFEKEFNFSNLNPSDGYIIKKISK